MSASEARKIARKSKGFCGYDWMIRSIIKHGYIHAGSEEDAAHSKSSEIPNSSGLISRQDVIDLWEKYHSTIAVDAMQYDAELRQLPSAQPEIIRCKDCRHNGSFDTDCPIGWNGKEYCSFAERKDND
jgi:hypothetical protein